MDIGHKVLEEQQHCGPDEPGTSPFELHLVTLTREIKEPFEPAYPFEL